MRPSQTLRVLEDLFVKQKGRLQRNGVELSLQDNQTTKEVYTQWVLLLVDLDYLSLVSHRALLGRIISDLFRRDVFDVVTALTDCVDNVRYQRIDGFEAHLCTISTHLPKVFRSSFEDVIQGNVKQAKRLIQAFSYMGRLTLQDIDLQDQCLSDYLETEYSMTENFPASLIQSLKTTISRWTSNFDLSDPVFRHGPGGVAGLGRTTLENKYKSLFRDDLIDATFGHDYYAGNSGITVAPDRISQTIFVPKSYKTFRTISMEPATLMYLQQSIWREIDQLVGRSTYLRNRIGFHDQTRNQKLALQGSITRDFATIDLSAASDSVSWELVRQLFMDTSLYPYLVATRSTHTLLPNGSLIELKKFAPMGSALCFPIETIIFAAICEHSCRKMSRVLGRDFTGDYSVFGDDIIVPSEVVKDLEWSLSSLGFSVNRSKSFTSRDDWFRESCGAEYCDGYDVTPLRVSRKYSSQLDDVALTGCVELSNACYERGFSNLRNFFISKMLTRKGFIPLFGSNALLGDSFSNFHTKTRINPHLQRNEAYVTQIVSRTLRGDESIALRHWLETCERRDDVQYAFEANVGRGISISRNRFSEIRSRIEIGLSPETKSKSSLALLNSELEWSLISTR